MIIFLEKKFRLKKKKKKKKINKSLFTSLFENHALSKDEILCRAISIQSVGSFPCVRNTGKREGASEAPLARALHVAHDRRAVRRSR